MNRQVFLKAQQIARLTVSGVPASRIAVEMGMSYDGVLRILKTEEYKQVEEEVQRDVLGKMDAKLAQRADMRMKMADEMEDEAVPEAWKVVIENLRKRRDLKTALEILDRDPQRQFARGAANAGQTYNGSQKPQAPSRPPIDSTALSQAIHDADITHDILQKSKSTQPAEA